MVRLAVVGFGLALLALGPCAIGSSAGSSAASSASKSVGSVSDSVGSSSDSSKGTAQVAGGRYQVEALVAGATGQVVVHARAGVDAEPLVLRLPLAAVTEAGLAVGHWIAVEQRPFGWALAREGEAPFFLLLNDGADLQTRRL